MRFGEASYALFLIHVPLAYLALLSGFDTGNGWIPLVLTLAASVAVFNLFEEPMRRRIRAHFRSGQRTVAPAPVTVGSGMEAG